MGISQYRNQTEMNVHDSLIQIQEILQNWNLVKSSRVRIIVFLLY